MGSQLTRPRAAQHAAQGLLSKTGMHRCRDGCGGPEAAAAQERLPRHFAWKRRPPAASHQPSLPPVSAFVTCGITFQSVVCTECEQLDTIFRPLFTAIAGFRTETHPGSGKIQQRGDPAP